VVQKSYRKELLVVFLTGKEVLASCRIHAQVQEVASLQKQKEAGVSISTDGQRNASATLLIKITYFFLERKKQKNISQNLNENVIMICFPKGPLVLLYALVM